VQQHLKDQRTDLQIPKVQKRTIANSTADCETKNITRDDAIIKAYASGAYSYQALAEHFGLHFTTIGRIVRQRAKS
jgi:dephospho-CoA kinase